MKYTLAFGMWLHRCKQLAESTFFQNIIHHQLPAGCRAHQVRSHVRWQSAYVNVQFARLAKEYRVYSCRAVYQQLISPRRLCIDL